MDIVKVHYLVRYPQTREVLDEVAAHIEGDVAVIPYAGRKFPQASVVFATQIGNWRSAGDEVLELMESAFDEAGTDADVFEARGVRNWEPDRNAMAMRCESAAACGHCAGCWLVVMDSMVDALGEDTSELLFESDDVMLWLLVAQEA